MFIFFLGENQHQMLDTEIVLRSLAYYSEAFTRKSAKHEKWLSEILHLLCGDIQF